MPTSYSDQEPARVQRRRRTREPKEPISIEVFFGILALVSLLAGAVVLLGILHLGGAGAEIIFGALYKVFGIFSYISPFIFFIFSYYLWKEELPPYSFKNTFGTVLLFLSVSSFLFLLKESYGGLLGGLVAAPLVTTFSLYVAYLVLFVCAVSGGLLLLNRKPSFSLAKASAFELKTYLRNVFSSPFGTKQDDGSMTEVEEEFVEDELVSEPLPIKNVREEILHEFDDEELMALQNEPKKVAVKPVILSPEFVPPPLELLNYDSGKSGAGDSKTKMSTIQRTLEHFRIRVEMGEVTVGPSVTQFTLKPAQGVNLSKIVSLHDNLAMELGAEFLRIEAPIPGKTLVGIEIPNEKKAMLGLRSMLELDEFVRSGPLTLAMGKSIIGKPIFGDLSKMPHLLVAGATRTGKSVTLQNLLLSLLYKNSPYDLKLIILDPKRVEFSAYHHLPHLYTPIIKEPKSAIKALNWAIQEMERRYEILAEHGQVNVDEYNKKVLGPALEKARKKASPGDELTNVPPKLPYVIIIFDEYNDFMLSYPKEITPLITALTQKGRAAGVHLILATQRPDVKVITGTIKANIPARVALKTTSQIDSRTILDASGAEDLLGNGDMLYMASDNPRLVRLQAPFVSTEEIRAVVDHIKQSHLDFVPDHIDISKVRVSAVASSDEEGGSSDEEPTDDDDYMSAKDYVVSTGKASTSSLQTAFRWGYNKAARIMNDLERYGVIGPSRPGERYREIIGGETSEENSLGAAEEVDDLLGIDDRR